jgi:hypothetical protein
VTTRAPRRGPVARRADLLPSGELEELLFDIVVTAAWRQPGRLRSRPDSSARTASRPSATSARRWPVPTLRSTTAERSSSRCCPDTNPTASGPSIALSRPPGAPRDPGRTASNGRGRQWVVVRWVRFAEPRSGIAPRGITERLRAHGVRERARLCESRGRPPGRREANVSERQRRAPTANHAHTVRQGRDEPAGRDPSSPGVCSG